MAVNPEDVQFPGEKLTVLVVDDEAVNRLVVSRMLADYQFNVIEAANGLEACEICLQQQPDLILMDIMMPRMNGFDATLKIKRHFGDACVPVIFLTAVADDQQLYKTIQSGGDDFLVKPISGPLLRAKIDSSIRRLKLHRRMEDQRDQLLRHQERLHGDMEIAQKILEAVESQHHLKAPNVAYLLRPMELMNGDVILAARRPTGDQVFMVGDFTGHGLPAAIGAQTVNGIFSVMVSKGLPLSEIVEELNRKMRGILPVGRFLSACMLEQENATGYTRVWNGGMPEVLVCNSNGEIGACYPSTDLPLGIVDDCVPTVATTLLSPGDLVVMYSDGVIEAQNLQGELFGRARLHAALKEGRAPAPMLANIVAAVDGYAVDAAQHDDLSILVVGCDLNLGKPARQETEQAIVLKQAALTWDYAVTLTPPEIRDGEPVAKVVQVLDAAQGLGPLRTQLFLILTELFSNALEHGLLKIDSSLKQDPEGFADYYALRASRLAALESGRIEFRFTHVPVPGGGRLLIAVQHNGLGFDTSVRLQELAENEAASGRGIALVRNLCSSLEYADGGCTAIATFDWHSAQV
jgi:two-component system, HptB-dependent secretion and biofilm response regulator